MIRILAAFAAGAVLTVSPAAAQGDPAAGEKVFRRCQACHAVGPNARNKVGPELNGVAGKPWAAVENYRYSKVLQDGGAQGKVWDDATLSAYLENPKAVAPKGKMAFAGLKKPDDRENVIAYLKQFDDSGQKQ